MGTRLLIFLALSSIIIYSCGKTGDQINEGRGTGDSAATLPNPPSSVAKDFRDSVVGSYSFIVPCRYQYLQFGAWLNGISGPNGVPGYDYGEAFDKDTGSFSITKPKAADSSGYIYLNQFVETQYTASLNIGFIDQLPPLTKPPQWYSNNPRTIIFTTGVVKFVNATTKPTTFNSPLVAKLKDSADVKLMTLAIPDYSVAPYFGMPYYNYSVNGNGIITKDSIIINYHSQYRPYNKYSRIAVARHK
ncbi:MAG: hypothetical protein JWN76_75 [Chitinophagaceae bacterium]|nr:hypothetical protein [Chitinophagaceae bacterium]